VIQEDAQADSSQPGESSRHRPAVAYSVSDAGRLRRKKYVAGPAAVYHQIVARAKGYHFALFNTREQAVAWLRQKPKP
jgi:hypothetical protein